MYLIANFVYISRECLAISELRVQDYRENTI